MKLNKSQGILVSLIVLLFATSGFPDSPPSNTIPIIAERPNDSEVDLDTFLMLSWHFFDALQSADGDAENVSMNILPPAVETGMFVCMNPAPTARWGHWPSTWAARMSDYGFSSDTAYARPVWAGITIDTVTYQSDALIKTFTAPEMADSLEAAAAIMEGYFGDEEQVWFYNTFDEASSRQWDHIVDDTSLVDDFIPNLYTQDRQPGSDSLPTFEEVDPQGIFSWLKYTMEQEDPSHPVVSAFAQLHTISWCGGSVDLGTFQDQANSVRSFMNMEYQGFGNPSPPIPQQNRPQMFVFDTYPIRQVGVSWLASHQYLVNTVSSNSDMTLLDHYEEGMDSTCIPVRQEALAQEREVPILFYPQAFGRCGGDVMWIITEPPAIDTLLNYESLQYRIPTPQEFLMNCNLALLRDVKGLIPYCMISYYSLQSDGLSAYMAGYLDRNNMPFDAPYEDWVYTDRWRSDFDVIPPDSFPPFSDSCRVCDDFDPLWDLPDRPTTTGERAAEDYLTWKFAAYARLWNSMKDIFGEIATIAPELSPLHWWEGYADCLVIDYENYYRTDPTPEIKLFCDGDSTGYAFYANRNCYDSSSTFRIYLYADSLPEEMDFAANLLDHSRRFLIPLDRDVDDDYWTFGDTLYAGQARLVQFFSFDLPADIRITRPDIQVSAQGSSGVYFTDEYRFPAERQTYIDATFYNMGLPGVRDVIVSLTDVTDEVVLDMDTISFSGLSGTLYQCDDQTVSFEWQPTSDDIGIHILEIAAESFAGEPDTEDNSTRIVFQITPRDYATTVLNDPWDMDDDTPPAWHTNDITSLVGWSSTYTDSISGMFEGTISDPSQSNKLVLNVGSGWSYDIPTRLYDRFSMVAKAESELTVTLHWQDESLQNHSIVFIETIGPDWTEMEPVDLTAGSSGWADEDAIKLWLEFSAASNMSKYVRIGWIKLTE